MRKISRGLFVCKALPESTKTALSIFPALFLTVGRHRNKSKGTYLSDPTEEIGLYFSSLCFILHLSKSLT